MSKSLPWFRAYTDMIDDEKLRLLAFEDRWHFVALLCCKGSGLLDAGDAPALLRRKLGVKLGLALRELEAMAERLAEVGLIDAKTFAPIGWDSRQFHSDADPTAAERKRRQRARERGEDASRVTVTKVTRTDSDTDTEKALRIGASKNKGKDAESQLEASIAHAIYVFNIDGNAEARDTAIAAAKAKHAPQTGATA